MTSPGSSISLNTSTGDVIGGISGAVVVVVVVVVVEVSVVVSVVTAAEVSCTVLSEELFAEEQLTAGKNADIPSTAANNKLICLFK